MGGRSIVRSHVSQLIGHLHLLLYLTLDTKEDDPDEKVINNVHIKVAMVDTLLNKVNIIDSLDKEFFRDPLSLYIAPMY